MSRFLLLLLLTASPIALKLLGAVDWPWWAVIAPLLVLVAVPLVALGRFLFVGSRLMDR